MLIVSDRDGDIVSFMSSDMPYLVDSGAMVREMFPDNEGLQFHVVDIDGGESLNGFKVKTEQGVVSKIYSLDRVLYEIDREELAKRVAKRAEEIKKKMFSKLPLKNNMALHNVFNKHIRKISDDHILESINNGSYFDSEIDIVGWLGPFLDAGGYASMNREIVQRLHRYNVLPIANIYTTAPHVDKGVESIIRDYTRLKPKKSSYPYVYAITPGAHPKHGGKRIFFTMMETTTLHDDCVRYCNEFSDEVWVPSHSNRDLFLSNGVKKNIKVVPLGIDEKRYFNTPDISERVDFTDCIGLYGTPPEKHIGKYKFLSVIQWNFRKGYDILVESFMREFSKFDDVCLIISSQYPETMIKPALDKHVKEKSDSPQVLLYNKIIPVCDMPAIYDACDCYIHTSRGEGFSLTQVEAAARGLPVISCYHTGMTEYMRDDNSYKIECHVDEPCCNDLGVWSYFYQGQRMWRLGEDQIDQARAHMRSVIDDPVEARLRARRMKRLVMEEFTWERTAERVAEVLRG